MITPWITVAAILGLALLYVFFPLAAHTFQRYREKRVLRCPEEAALAEINIDARYAAFSSTVGKPALRVRDCNFWPKRKGCRQGCLSESAS
ncbi:MAG: hypothetical protein HYV04_01805 [Deltaproteobacteria bacterium]|nr:hypothetical protein [Deltaproteobacteria bacterium]